MAIGERIRFFRTLRGMTQKYLGLQVGFPERSADVRMAQYETGARRPKEELTRSLAHALDVSPLALEVPDIDSYLGLMHTLFTLEDCYGLVVEQKRGNILLRFDPRRGKDAARIAEMVTAWANASERCRKGAMSKEDYDRWRYHYPRYDQGQISAEVPSQQFSDDLQKTE